METMIPTLRFDPYTIDIHNSSTDPIIQQTVSNTLNNCSDVTDFRNIGGGGGLAVVSCNIDGFKSNFEEFVTRCEMLSNPAGEGDNRPTAFTFCETNLTPGENTSVYNMPGYKAYHTLNTTGKVKGSGISMFLKNNVNFCPHPPFIINCKSFQSYGGTVQLSNGQSLNLICLYRYHIGTDWDTWFADIESLLKKACTTKVILTGDFNMNLFKLDSSSQIRRYFDLFNGFGLVPMISRATNHTNTSSTLIDQTWSNIISHDCSSHIISSLGVSTHVPTLCCFPDPYLVHDDQGPKTIVSTDFSSASLVNFRKDYELQCTPYINSIVVNNSIEEISQSFSHYYSQLVLLYDKHFVKRKTITNQRNQVFKPWVSPSLAKACHTKSILYKTWVKTRGTPHEKDAARQYRSYRAVLRDLLVKARDDYFTSRFVDCNNDIKKCWAVINEIRGSKGGRATYPSCVSIDNQDVTDMNVIVNGMNNHFTSVAVNLNDHKYGTIKPNHNLYGNFMSARVNDSMFLMPVSADEISILIKGLKPKKSADFSSDCLKHLNMLFSIDLANIFNKCMVAGVFPNELKQATIQPLYKGGDINTLSNYRPISLLPIISKLFEKCLHKRVTEFLFEHKVLCSSQFGFRKGLSTTNALHEGIGFAAESLDHNFHTLGLFLDLSKAFDTLHHDILLAKMEHYGIRGCVLDLFKSYLSNRIQRVKIGNNISSPGHVSYGVPQGSTLGPLLFLLYINNLVNITNTTKTCSIKFILFADDTSIFISGKNKVDVQLCINSLMNSLKNYFDANYLHVNIAKTKFMHFSTPQSINFPSDFVFMFNGTPIEQVKQFKFLGVEITTSLTWEAHINSVASKLHRNMGSIYRLRNALPNNLRLPVYHALFQSHINYSLSVWGSNGAYNKLLPIFKAQKNALRCIFSLKTPHGVYGKPSTKPSFNQYNILNVYQLYFLAVLKEVHSSKILNDGKISFSARKPNLALSPSGTHKYLDVNFLFAGPRIWNHFSPKNTFTHSFNRDMKRILLDNQKMGDPVEWVDVNLKII
eukprot:sb/3461526/